MSAPLMTPLSSAHVANSSVTLVGEADRKMLKAAIKHSSGEDQVRHRQVPPEVVSKWAQKLDGLRSEISEILQEEKEEKQVCSADERLTRPSAIVLIVMLLADSTGRDGTQEGRKHDRARSGDLLASCADLVPDREGKSQGRG